MPITIKPASPASVKIEKLSAIQVPLPLATRENPLIKKIETEETNLVLELYNN